MECDKGDLLKLGMLEENCYGPLLPKESRDIIQLKQLRF